MAEVNETQEREKDREAIERCAKASPSEYDVEWSTARSRLIDRALCRWPKAMADLEKAEENLAAVRVMHDVPVEIGGRMFK
jgi:hypothetical protein